MTADNNDNSPKSPTEDLGKLKLDIDSRFKEMAEKLEAMTRATTETISGLAQAVMPAKRKEPAIDDSDIYDASKLANKVESVAQRIASEALAKERKLNAKIAELSNEYPEITRDDKVRQAVIEAHNSLPEALRESVEGYEMAVYRAVAKSGIVPKSKRQTQSESLEDIPSGRAGSSRQSSGGKGKVTPEMLAFAEMLGRPVDDPEYIKRLEKAASRNFNKYQ